MSRQDELKRDESNHAIKENVFVFFHHFIQRCSTMGLHYSSWGKKLAWSHSSKIPSSDEDSYRMLNDGERMSDCISVCFLTVLWRSHQR